MAATDHLQPNQFFHGSPEHFEPGDTILPTQHTGKAPTRGDSAADKVYVTPHQFVAAQYTWKYDTKGALADDPSGPPSGHIYEVEPAGRLLHDKNAPMRGLSYTAKQARVIRRVPKEEWSR